VAESGTVDLVPLAIYAEVTLTAFDWAQIKAAKERLDLPFLVQPGVAVAGTQTRVLAIGAVPPFICDYAFVPSAASPGLPEALAWTLTDSDDPRATLMTDMLSAAFKTIVTEVEDERGPQPTWAEEQDYRAAHKGDAPAAGSVIAGR
jgi:hypothetical protein